MKKKRTVRIADRHIQNYLGAKGIWPIEDFDDGPVFYLATEKLRAALTSYDIEYYCFRRRY